jgi:hypothetical protein
MSAPRSAMRGRFSAVSSVFYDVFQRMVLHGQVGIHAFQLVVLDFEVA